MGFQFVVKIGDVWNSPQISG